MGKDMTQRTTRGMTLESFLKSALQAPVKQLAAGDVAGAKQRLRDFLASQQANFLHAIDRAILPRLRTREVAKPYQQRKSEEQLKTEARELLLRDFEPLLMAALTHDQRGFFEEVLCAIGEIHVLGVGEFRRVEARLLPRNPIAFLWAIHEAYKTGEPVSETLGIDEAMPSRYAHQAGRAAEFIRALKMLTPAVSPGYQKIQALVMREGESSSSPIIEEPKTPEPKPAAPSITEMPTQEMVIRRVELVFQGEEEVQLFELLKAKADERGGLEKFLLLLATSIKKQQK